jgi:predicted AAA+ superfamily ATPase
LEWTEDYDIVFIDEAQNIPNVGSGLKLLIDQRPSLNIIATGSASFDLSNKLGEPLVGRQTPLQLFPVSILELRKMQNAFETKQQLGEYLVYGMYPEILTARTIADKKRIVNELARSYLLKDVLQLENVKNPATLFRLLALLAYQIGSEVSTNELANQLGIDKNTVARYLYLLEKCYVIYNLRGFSRNLRNEVTKTGKYYFYDVGVRNAVIQNYSPVETRDDIGHLWENWVIMERVKKQAYANIFANSYFWRTWEKQEIDFVEEQDGKLRAYEIKWGKSGHRNPPSQWEGEYGEKSEFAVINRDNFLGFVS